VFNDSFVDLYNAASAHSVEVLQLVVDAWRSGVDSLARHKAVVAAVGNSNLSDGRPGSRPCKKRHAGPLPLRELQAAIRASIREGRGGRLASKVL
jgi:hypothetical protein